MVNKNNKLRGILINKWVYGAVFFIVLSVVCLFWYQHDIEPYRQGAEDTKKLLQESNIIKESDIRNEPEPSAEPLIEHSTQKNRPEYTLPDNKNLNIQPSQTETWIQNRVQREAHTEVYDKNDLIQASQETKDPIVLAELLHLQLLTEYGDRPEIHIIRKYQIDKANKIPSNIDKEIEYLEAHYTLFKDKSFLQAIEEIRKSQKENVTIIFK